jgi:hypothetical protein
MTAQQLRDKLNREFGFIDRPWPRSIEVDADTYANCCQAIFDYVNENLNKQVSLGVENNGLIFKNIELIYRPKL